MKLISNRARTHAGAVVVTLAALGAAIPGATATPHDKYEPIQIPQNELNASSDELTNGSPIVLRNGTKVIGSCSATVTDRNYILTAGHCGNAGVSVEFDGKKIGTAVKNGLADGFDVLKIELNPHGKKVLGEIMEVDEDYAPKEGDPVSKEGFRSKHTEGTVAEDELSDDSSAESINEPSDGPRHLVQTWFADLLSVPGDSGGPVIHDDKVIGLIKGGRTKDDTTVTPIKESLEVLN